MSFKNKVVLVTGSGSGIGEATAILFVKEGADLVIVDWNEQAANKTAEKCKKFNQKVLVIKTDVCKDEELKNAIEETIKEFGKLDVLVNNAGIVREGNLSSGNIMNTYDEILNINLRSVVQMTTLAIPHLTDSKGCIVNTSSNACRVMKVASRYPAYAISKVGIETFTLLSALELASSGVRVNAVSPGPVHTNILINAGIEHGIDEHAKCPLGKISDPIEIADLIVYLSSDKAKSITGSIFAIDNGVSLV